MSENLENLEGKISQIIDLVRNTKNSYDFSAETYIHILEKINNRLNDLQGLEPADVLDLKDRIKDLSGAFKSLDNKSEIKYLTEQVEYLSASQQKSDKSINDFSRTSNELMQKLAQIDPSSNSYINELKTEVVNALDVVKQNIAEFEQSGISGLKVDIREIANIVKESHLELTKGAQNSLSGVVEEFKSYVEHAQNKLNSMETLVSESLQKNSEMVSQSISEDLIGNIYVLKNAIVAIKDSLDKVESDKIDKNYFTTQLNSLQDKFVDLSLNGNMAISQEFLKLSNGLVSIKTSLDSFENNNFSQEMAQQFRSLEKKFIDIDESISTKIVRELQSIKEESALLKDTIFKGQIDSEFIKQQYSNIESRYNDLDFNITTTFTNEFSQLLAETLELKKSLVFLKDSQLDSLYVKEQFSSIVDKYDVLNNNISISITNEFNNLKENTLELRQAMLNLEQNQVDRLFLQTQLDGFEQKFIDIDAKISNTISEEFGSLKSVSDLIKDLASKQIDEKVLKAHFDSMQEKFVDLNINTNMAISQELLKLNEEFMSLGTQIQSIEEKQIDKAIIQHTLEGIEEKFTDLNLNINNNFFEELAGLNQQSLILRETFESFDDKLVDKVALKDQLERLEQKYTHIDEALSINVNNELTQLTQDTALLKDLVLAVQDKQLDGDAFRAQFESFALKFQEIDKNIALTISGELMTLREESTNLKHILDEFTRKHDSSSTDMEGMVRLNQQLFELDGKVELLTKDINLNISHEISQQREYLENFASKNNGNEPVKELLEDFATRLQDLEGNVTLSISNEIMNIRQEAYSIKESFDAVKDNTQLFEQFDLVREKIAGVEGYIQETVSPQLIQLRESVESLNRDENYDGDLMKQVQSLQYKIDSLETNLNTSHIFNEFKAIQEKISELDTNISLAVSHELIEVREETTAIRNAIDELVQKDLSDSNSVNENSLNEIYERFASVFVYLEEIKEKYSSIENLDVSIEQKISNELSLLKSEVQSVKEVFAGLESKIDNGALVQDQFERFLDRFNQIEQSVNSTISYEISQIRQDSLSVKELLEEYQYRQGDETSVKDILNRVQSEVLSLDEKLAKTISDEIEKVKVESTSIRGSLEGLSHSGVIDDAISEQIALLFDKLNSISSSISSELDSIKDESNNLKTIIENYKPQDIDDVLIFENFETLHSKFNDLDGLMNNILLDDVHQIKEFTAKLKDSVDDVKDIKIEQAKLIELINLLSKKVSEIDNQVANDIISDLADIKIDANSIKESSIEGFAKLNSSAEVIVEKINSLDERLALLDSGASNDLLQELSRISAETLNLKETLGSINLKQIDDELVKAEFKVLQEKVADIDSSINATISEELSQIRQESLGMKEFFEDIEFNQIDEEMLNNHFENVSERISKFETILEGSIGTEFEKVRQDFTDLKEGLVSLDNKQIEKTFHAKNFENIKERIFDLDSKLNQRITEEFGLIKQDSTEVKILLENLIKSQTTTILDEFEVVRDKFNDLQVYINESENTLFNKVCGEFEEVKQETTTIKQLIRDLDEKQVNEGLVEQHLVNIKDRLQNIDIDVNSKIHQELNAIKEESKLLRNTISNIEETQIDKLTIKEQFEFFSEKFNKFKENVENGLTDSFVDVLSNSNALKEVFNDIEIKQFDGGFIKSQIEGVLEKFDKLELSLNNNVSNSFDKFAGDVAGMKLDVAGLLSEVLQKDFVEQHFKGLHQKINELDTNITNKVINELSKIEKNSDGIKQSIKTFDTAVDNIARIEANQIDMAESLRDQVQNLQEQLIIQMLQLFENMQTYDDKEDIKECIESLKDKVSEDIANIKYIVSNSTDSKNDVVEEILTVNKNVKHLTDKLDGVNVTAQGVETLIHNVGGEISVVNEHVRALENGFSEKITGVSKSIESLADKFGGINFDSHDIEKLMSNFRGDVVEEILSVNKEIDALVGKLDEVTSVSYNVETSVSTIKDQITEIEYSVRNLPSIVEELKGKMSNLETTVSDIPSLIHSLDDNLSRDMKTVVDSVESSTANVSQINNRLEALLKEVKTLTGGNGSQDDNTYAFPDVEEDIAKVRLALNEFSNTFKDEQEFTGENLRTISGSLQSIQRDVEKFTEAIPSVEFMKMRDRFDSLNDDITSISKRTNKLIITSDDSNRSLRDNLNELRDIAKRLGGGVNLPERLDGIDNALLYFAEWIDKASVTMNDLKLDMNVVRQNADPMKTEPTYVEVQTLKLLINDLHQKTKQGFQSVEEQNKQIKAIEKKIVAKDTDVLADRLEAIERQMIKFEKNINKIVAFIDEE